MQLTPTAFIENLFDTMLDGLDDKLAATLRERYEEDQKAFCKAAEEAQGSTELSYWAERNCNKCHGRGIIGIIRQRPEDKGKPLQCKCAPKRYFKWLKAFRVEFNEKRDNAE
jgi:hypothetical protein